MSGGDAIRKAEREWSTTNRDALERDGLHRVQTDFGLDIKPVYTPADLEAQGFDYLRDVGFPGSFPFTRGNTPTMYRDQPWRIGQYAGFATAQESNALFKNLIAHGQTELSLAFDLPTQLGYDPDDPRAQGEVGKVGISLASLRDWEVIFDGIPMDKVYVYSVSNAQAVVTIAMHLALARKQGADLSRLRGGMQNDVLKEYVARGNYIFPIDAGMRLAADTLLYCAERVPEYWTINVGGYHICEAGANTVHEGAFTLAIALAYLDQVHRLGVAVEKVASKVSFLMTPNHNRFFEDIAKFRACRRLWARLLVERYQINDPGCQVFRLYAHNGGSVLTRQHPETNITRSAIAAVIGALAGAQNICLRTMDECLGIPSEKSQVIGIRSQQVVAYETGITRTVDPLGGSYFVETLTNEYEQRIRAEIEKVDAFGGMAKAIVAGYVQKIITQDALELQRKVDSGEIVKVGLNRFQAEEEESGPRRHYRADPRIEEMRKQEVQSLRAQRDDAAVARTLDILRDAARRPASSDNNLMEPVMDAVLAYATMGEICGALRDVFGTYDSAAAV
ncbi:MAG: methylmalonyl-CoA mutase family protein [Betaproteobacteria bacterium]|nr:methylmalonyl-CoA mutase family protein [Betaproteobacteria bacterium]